MSTYASSDNDGGIYKILATSSYLVVTFTTSSKKKAIIVVFNANDLTMRKLGTNLDATQTSLSLGTKIMNLLVHNNNLFMSVSVMGASGRIFW